MIHAGIKFPASGDYCNHDVIENTLKYIFCYPTEHQPDRKPIPIHFYGIPYIGYPPQVTKIIEQYQFIRQKQSCTIPQQVWHFQITFPFLFSSAYEPYFYFADQIARLFCYEYPICYAYHSQNKNTGNSHSHFHYVISTSSYRMDYPALDPKRMMDYLAKMPAIAQPYGIQLQHLQNEEELKCLNLTTIF